jgi:hypothetical protein
MACLPPGLPVPPRSALAEPGHRCQINVLFIFGQGHGVAYPRCLPHMQHTPGSYSGWRVTYNIVPSAPSGHSRGATPCRYYSYIPSVPPLRTWLCPGFGQPAPRPGTCYRARSSRRPTVSLPFSLPPCRPAALPPCRLAALPSPFMLLQYTPMYTIYQCIWNAVCTLPACRRGQDLQPRPPLLLQLPERVSVKEGVCARAGGSRR